MASSNETGPSDGPSEKSSAEFGVSSNARSSRTSAPNGTVAVVPEQKMRYTRNTTGCLTCRIRKVRCDETKPDCVRCTSTGRKCDGYPPPQVRVSKKRSSKSPGSSSPSSPLALLWSVEECRGFAYFQTRTATALSGRFLSPFWNSLVLQAAHNEPAVLQALITVAQFHERLEIGGVDGIGQFEGLQQAAVRNYSKALSMARELQSVANPDATLIACVLFVCIELMQNNYNGAYMHAKHGLRILEQLQARQPFSSSSPASDARKLLVQMFRNILNQAFFIYELFGRGRRDLLTPLVDTPPTDFMTLDQAHEALQRIGLLIQRSRRIGGGAGSHDVHCALLRQWQASTARLIAGLPSAEAKRAATILQLQAMALSTMNDAFLNGDAAFEAATPTFEAIVAGAAELLESEDRTQRPSQEVNLSFEAGLIGPLYYTAMKCRALRVRLHALLVLGLAPRQEGIWSASMAAGIATRFVKVEMEELGGELLGDVSSGGWVSQGGLTMAVGAPRAYERAIRMKIGRKCDGGMMREEVITW
ncbi:hypothetical protein POJ06DRAFT_204448 [Lipomyces tetrasporus]|uniref:Zn(2)-C6 fungal-type domain-containing protein n=1 Tax=Lipomyces tetrasporus TaxID=54092 RepID=A0AAD7QYB5_9ASCO|nr:uncharacterized protein POJ06DRAFT_204448 [Lipomyces tetrasporus]KAJ8103685.1 hypothetical protein POJ06DRAFT_204448 [Lipomyces tetrasporus]